MCAGLRGKKQQVLVLVTPDSAIMVPIDTDFLSSPVKRLKGLFGGDLEPPTAGAAELGEPCR